MMNEDSIQEVNAFINAEVAIGRYLVKIDYGRRTEDSYPTNPHPPLAKNPLMIQ
eukprot:Awhi_evm1s12277